VSVWGICFGLFAADFEMRALSRRWIKGDASLPLTDKKTQTDGGDHANTII
jgi:hypothetical protein